MADDLNFKHAVQQIPAQEQLPNPIQRNVGIETHNIPDFQGAMTNYADSTNWMSRIGSDIAAKSSNALASKIGTQLGKNPKGNIGIPITDFDKTMQQSYLTQAQATLGLQADKLITQSNIETASASRITPDLIQKSQASISHGLQNIFAHAPEEIQGNLTKVYGASQLNQLEHLTNRMLSEQHEDRRNNTILSNNKNAETVHALAASGKFDEAERLIKSTEAINNSAVESNIGFTPQQAKVGTDTVRQSAIAGRLQHEYEKAVTEKKGDEYLKSLAKKPDWISDSDYPTATQSLLQYVSHQNALKSNYEQLTMSDFKTRMITDIGSITGTELQSTLDKLSPINASKLNNEYANAYRTYKKEGIEQNNLITHWEDPTAQANASEKVKNNTFNGKVAYVMNAMPGTTREEAETQVAASAGAAIPVFTQTIHNKLWSGDATSMVAAAKQIDTLQSDGNGHALAGVNEQDLALASDIKHNYNPADPASAARIITQNKQNQDATFRKESESTFANMIFDNTRKNNKPTDDYILETFGMQGGLFNQGLDSPWSKSNYASDILSNYRTNFINSGRDNDRALAMTKQYIANNYGKTSINGGSEWTLHPIEKACGFNEGEGLSTINADIVRQVTPSLQEQKKLYDEKYINEFWTIEPVIKKNEQIPYAGTMRKGEQIKSLNFMKHTRQGASTKTESYPLRLVGNNFNWELNLVTKDAPISIFLVAPQIGVHTYTPDLKWIKENQNG